MRKTVFAHSIHSLHFLLCSATPRWYFTPPSYSAHVGRCSMVLWQKHTLSPDEVQKTCIEVQQFTTSPVEGVPTRKHSRVTAV